jgi:hypothetical protein
MAKTTTKKVTMEKVTINGIVRTEALRLADLTAILNGEELSTEIIEDLKNYVTFKAAQVANRTSSHKDDEEKKAAREEIRTEILAFLTAHKGEWFRVGEIVKGSPVLDEKYSSSAVTSVITKLKDEGLVWNESTSKKSVYTIATEPDEDDETENG